MGRRLIALGVLGLVGIVFAGCGSGGVGLVGAKGKVLYKGQPVSGASVTFKPANGPLALGLTDANGEFTMSTGGRPGVVVGEHEVSITKVAATPAAPTPMTPEDMRKMAMSGGSTSSAPKSEIPERYANPTTSKLVASVVDDASKNVFEYALVD